MTPTQCKGCGGALRRSRRNLLERVLFSEAFRCGQCGKRVKTISSFDMKSARYVKCPCCSSVDLSILRRPDKIDRMRKGLLNILHRLAGGKLYHCWFCRLQFYDVRKRLNTIPQVGNRMTMPAQESDGEVELAS